jgi:hypothetical protein
MVRQTLATAVLTLTVTLLTGTCFGQMADATTPQNLATPAVPVPAEIPLDVLSRVLHGFQGFNEVKTELPNTQKEAMRKSLGTHAEANSIIGQMTAAISASSLSNRRFNAAARQLKEEQDALQLKEWLAILTPEQQALIRRRNRKAIMQANLQRPSAQQALLYDTHPIDALMTNNDLLSVIERPGVQDTLEITDEQLAQIIQLQQAADADALTVLRQNKDIFTRQKPELVQNQAVAKLHADTRQILTQEQWDQDQTILRTRAQQNPAVPANGLANRAHGMPVEMTTKFENGKATVNVTLFNGFAEPSLVEALKLTEQQQTQLSQRVEQAEEEFIAATVKQLESNQLTEQARKQKLNELLAQHNGKIQAQAVAILTDEQTQRLQKERLRGLGIRALEKPEVEQALQITSEQKASITGILKRPLPAFPVA